MLKSSAFLILLAAVRITYCQILMPPETERVLQGNNGTFECTGSGEAFWWVVNTTNVHERDVQGNQSHVARLMKRGFSFKFNPIKPSNNQRLTLKALASIDNNNTELSCGVTDGSGVDRYSDTAYLIVEGPPTPSAISLEDYNATTLLMSWESPFTWPNFSIAQYNVNITVDGYHTELVTFTAMPDQIQYSMMISTPSVVPSKEIHCLEVVLTVAVVSMSSDGREFVRKDSVTGGFPVVPGPIRQLRCSILIDSEADENPKLKASFTLPSLCSYGRANYTIAIQTPNSREMSFGPTTYNPQSTRTVNELIDLGQWFLTGAVRYSVTVTVTTAVESSHSDCVVVLTAPEAFSTLDTSFPTEEGKSTNIPLIIGVTLGGVSVILIIIVIGITLHCSRTHHLKQSAQGELTIAQPSLIPNPIYEGPLYETIEHQLNTLTPDPTKNGFQFNSQDTDEHTQTDISENDDDVRYLKNPVHFTRDAMPSGPQLQGFLAFLDATSESSVDSPDSTCSLLHGAPNSPQEIREDRPPLPKLATQGATSETSSDPSSATPVIPQRDESGILIQEGPPDGHVEDNYTIMSPATDTTMFTADKTTFSFSFPPPTCT